MTTIHVSRWLHLVIGGLHNAYLGIKYNSF